MSLRYQITNIITHHISINYGDDVNYIKRILDALRILLRNNLEEYNIPSKISLNINGIFKSYKNIQEELSKVNEKESRRKKEGVYYTDRDVTNFMVENAFIHYLKSDSKKVDGIDEGLSKLNKLNTDDSNYILEASILDPTCGTGEFLLSALELKLKINNKKKKFSLEDIISTIYGNDKEELSTEISKLRLFFILIDNSEKLDNLDNIASIINKNFTSIDAVLYERDFFGKKDIIVGNPPYVEYGKYEGTTKFKYGNVYADVLHNSINCLSSKGVMSFIIPLSYVSTIRMIKIRNYISSYANKQILLNFADRPDCLFSSVHQKLTILLAQKNAIYEGILSSSYNYWYKSERAYLFNQISLSPINNEDETFCPKIGNKIELAIFNKIRNISGKNINEFSPCKTESYIYINQRACFWMKAFTHDMESNSYTKYYIPEEYLSFTYCLVNSSLFFLIWVIISDGWHITNKELSFIKIPANYRNLSSCWDDLRKELEIQLEQTKVYVGTKQVEYEYKHKDCKNTIDKIDNALARVYKINENQLNYIKGFALKYRLGYGA